MSESKYVPILPGEKFKFEKEYRCPYCSEKFFSNYAREAHINTFHPMERKHRLMREGI